MGWFRRRRSALARRYGHFGMAELEKADGNVRKLAKDHPIAAAAIAGATVGAVAGHLGASTGAMLGAVAAGAAQLGKK